MWCLAIGSTMEWMADERLSQTKKPPATLHSAIHQIPSEARPCQRAKTWRSFESAACEVRLLAKALLVLLTAGARSSATRPKRSAQLLSKR